MRERTKLDRGVNGYRQIERRLEESLELIELAEAEGEQGLVKEAEANLETLRAEVAKRQLESLLSGEAGGTEAQDWAELLMRMYARWAEQHGYKLEWLEESPGEETGIKSATLKVVG